MVATVAKGRKPKPKALDGKKLREFRTARGLTQPAFAELVSVHEVDISRYERGEVDPSLHTIATIARVLEVTVDQLLKDKDE